MPGGSKKDQHSSNEKKENTEVTREDFMLSARSKTSSKRLSFLNLASTPNNNLFWRI